MAYYVSLRQFEGPLDLLLHLISKAKVDIRDIFISEITEQYLQSMQGIDELDMDAASEFLEMAATLLEIKSRALLPRPPKDNEGEESPEQMLIRRLEEYKLYKESAGRMMEFERAAMQVFSKLPEEYPVPPTQVELTGLTIDNLMKAMQRILARRVMETEEPGRVFRAITRDTLTIEQCTYHMAMRLKRGPVLFSELLSQNVTRSEVVSYFMAMLEMLKLGRLHVEQEHVYDDILLMPGRRFEDDEDDGNEGDTEDADRDEDA